MRPINRTTIKNKGKKDIGKIVKEMKWVMRTNESARIKGRRRHGKRISLVMSKDRGI